MLRPLGVHPLPALLIELARPDGAPQQRSLRSRSLAPRLKLQDRDAGARYWWLQVRPGARIRGLAIRGRRKRVISRLPTHSSRGGVLFRLLDRLVAAWVKEPLMRKVVAERLCGTGGSGAVS